ncbi:hypothetical protein [Flexivirga caeni]|nr:hypothetical protein [Flexivirga caeni]
MTDVPTGDLSEAPILSGEAAEVVRRRVRLLVEITSHDGKFRDGLQQAGRRLTRPEATIIADLERHGLDVTQLREILWGGHVLVDDPALYTRWRFPKTIERLSSHHPDIDKKLYPDLGMKGPLVREKLHGRTATGTWVQLEKTPTAMGPGFHLPTTTDVRHLCDYVVYRFTKSNVGPWGLSKQTERRPVYLSPALSAAVPVAEAAEHELVTALNDIEHHADATSISPDLATRFPPPHRADSLAELVLHPDGRNGRGLFGSSEVYASAAPSDAARAVIDKMSTVTPHWALPEPGETTTEVVHVGDREIRLAVRRTVIDETEENA